MFVKLFNQILDSSIADDRKLRHFFTDILLCSDAQGFVMMTESAIARRIGASIDEVKWGIDQLMSPDPRSKTPDNEGRRLESVDGSGYGWRIINFESYKALRSAEDMREKTRERVRRFRDKQKDSDPCNATVTPCNAGNAIKKKSKSKKKIENKEEPPNPQRGEAAPSLPHQGDFREAWSRWEKHRREIKKPLRPTQTEAQLKKLATMTEARAVAMIDHTIEMGWQGLREGEQVNGSVGNKKSQSTLQELMGGRKLNITKASDIENNEHEFENEPDF